MRKRYLISYDIRESSRLLRVHKKLLGYGDPVQYSVFLCELSDREKLILISKISEMMNLAEDSLMIVDLGPSNTKTDKRIQTIGKNMKFRERGAIVI